VAISLAFTFSFARALPFTAASHSPLLASAPEPQARAGLLS
jgi:hypothetical protein